MGPMQSQRQSGWPFVRTMIVLDEVDSTSDRAAELVQAEGSPCRCASGRSVRPAAGDEAIIRGGRIPAV